MKVVYQPFGMYPAILFFTDFYIPDSPEDRVLDVTTDYKLGYFFHKSSGPNF